MSIPCAHLSATVLLASSTFAIPLTGNRPEMTGREGEVSSILLDVATRSMIKLLGGQMHDVLLADSVEGSGQGGSVIVMTCLVLHSIDGTEWVDAASMEEDIFVKYSRSKDCSIP